MKGVTRWVLFAVMWAAVMVFYMGVSAATEPRQLQFPQLSAGSSITSASSWQTFVVLAARADGWVEVEPGNVWVYLPTGIVWHVEPPPSPRRR
jgi:hypothetical protein